jgi:NAD(P)-dependent dehydrogenase (short-subunit alcohol dehydrogenase family)
LAVQLLDSETKRKAADERHPLKRAGRPADIAAAALYLLEGSWVTGQILHVDGGMGVLRTFK